MMDAGQTFTSTLAGGGDAEMIYWGQAEDGGWLVTWASRHMDGFTPSEGPKDASEPFVIYDAGEVAARNLFPRPDAPYMTHLVPGARWVTQTDRRTGVVIEMGVGAYMARDEAYNGIAVMADGHARRVLELAKWRDREGRREPQGPGQPQIGAQVKTTLPSEALTAIDSGIAQGTYRTRSQAVRRIVMEALARRPGQG